MLRDKIIQLLEIRGLSHAQLALRAGVSRSAISKFLEGKRRDMTFSNVAAIARALNVSLDWLADMPTKDENALTPYEDELLRLYRMLPDDFDRQMTLVGLRAQVELVRSK